jgi:uncharacterized tellurite resistance protein B-like protein
VPTLESADPALAFALCLARMADCDDVVSDEERALLDHMGASLDPSWSASSLLQVARTVTLRELVDSIDNPADRFFLAARAWAMANADGMLDPRERALFVELVEILGLSDEDQELARRLVASQGRLDPALEERLRATHAGSSLSALAPVPLSPDGPAAISAALNLAQTAVQDELLSTLRAVSAALLPDASPARVSALSELLAEPRLLEVLDDLDRQAECDAHRLGLLEDNEDLRKHTDRVEAFASRRDAARERIELLKARHQAYQRDDFQWLYARNHHADQQRDTFQQFVRMVTLAPWRERRAEEDALAALEMPDFRCAVEEYHRLERDLRRAQRELERVSHAETALEEMLLEREELRELVALEPERRVQGVRHALVDAFTRTHLSALYPDAPEPQQAQLARCCLLEAKLAMLERLRSALRTAERARDAAPAEPVSSVDSSVPDGALDDSTLDHGATPGPPAAEQAAEARLQALLAPLDRLRQAVVDYDQLESWQARLEEGCPTPAALFDDDPELRALADAVLEPGSDVLEAAATVLS